MATGGSAKLFVGCLPYSKTEADLEPVFNQFGPLAEVKVLTGPDGSSKGAAFVTYQDETHAVTAMSYLQGHVLDGSTRGMNISFATSGGPRGGGGAAPAAGAPFRAPQQQQPPPPPAGGGNKLFVGCLPYSKTEADLEPVFSQFGALQEVKVITGPDGSSKGAAFVTFQDENNAVTAMSYLQGHVLEGSNRGMNISFATSGGPRGGGGAAPMAGGGKGAPYQPPPPPGSPLSHLGTMPGSQPGPPGSKIFVGQLPYSRSETDLLQLFGSVGPVAEVIMLTDKKTGEKKGAAFVKYQAPQHAQMAASTLNGFLFTGSTRPITVSLAQNDSGGAQPQVMVPPSLGTMPGQAGGKRPAQQAFIPIPGYSKGPAAPAQAPQAYVESEPGSKLFVGQLPFSRSEDEISQVFSQYGTVVEVLLHRDAQGQKKGGAFVRFETASSAAAALDLDGYMFQGSTRPITVAMAGEGVKKRRMA